MTNKEFKQKLIELNVLDLYLESVKECESGENLTTGEEDGGSFYERISCSFIWGSAKSPEGKDSLVFWESISKSK
jgi:hypothetical protein